MARRPNTDFAAWPALTLEGNLIAPAMIALVVNQRPSEKEETTYGLRKGLTIRDEITLAFRVGQAHYDDFTKLTSPSLPATTRFVSSLLTEAFNFADIAQDTLPIALSAGTGRVPVVVVPPSDTIDRRSAILSTDRSRSAAFALQDNLNARDDAMWGLATNGTVLRLMRDNASLTRPAYIEANLAQIFQTEDLASFATLWLLIHRSRFGQAGTPATDCALERWRESGAKEGEVARDRLAKQVEEALKILGSGFLEANPGLRAQLTSGQLPLTQWFNELLRLIYRLIFLMVAEDRNLLHPETADPDAKSLYHQGYSLSHLRDQALRRTAWDRHHDRYEGLKVTFRALTRGEPLLALPALGGLFTATQLPHLDTAKLPNKAFLNALYRLAYLKTDKAILPVNWRAMETEELGSVYESLLELQPQLTDNGKALTFATESAEQKGNQRKTTGSYYTPDSLVQALLDTALNPVIDQCEAADDPARALLNLTVIDPACGSGHFLLAAARRIATRLARHRAHGTPAATDFRHALRDVARHCLHGVDRNPMAVELTKVALWIETVDPGKPLGFFDAQIRCGDALLGIFDLKALDAGIPDAAYKPLSGDDKPTAKYYAKANKDAKSGQATFDFERGRTGLPEQRQLAADYTGFRALTEDTLDQIEAKRAGFDRYRNTPRYHCDEMACDLYVAAFLLPKLGGAPSSRGARQVPTSEDVWIAKKNGQVWGPLIGKATVARTARAFHWPLEFPDVMQPQSIGGRGGFDVVLGNPPYGAEVDEGAREIIRLNQPMASSASNTGADFISLAFGMMAKDGAFGLVVPKSVTYSNAWRGVRSHAIPRLISTVDVGQAWPNVALEMVLLFCAPQKLEALDVPLRRGLDCPPISVPRELAMELDIIPTGLGEFDREILVKCEAWLNPRRRRDFSTVRGKGLQRFAKDEGAYELLAGRNIAPFSLHGPWKYISESVASDCEVVPTGSVVFQNIVAHLLNPSDHIRLIGTVTDRPVIALDTVNIIKHPSQFSPHAVAAFLMSDFVSWFVYVAGFNRAVRTMHFDNYILEKLPQIPQETLENLDSILASQTDEITVHMWDQINDAVSSGYELDRDTRRYLYGMHSRKGK